ncbi:MAG: chorismate-binding protein [Fimbriimonadaceae bacterium]|nr:chorismate-binding protein [Fimbriimonadaceae bacterium]
MMVNAPAATVSLAEVWQRVERAGWSVAVFRRPGESTVWLVASPRLIPGKTSLVRGQSGFAVAPFERGKEQFIPADLMMRWPILDVSRNGTVVSGSPEEVSAVQRAEYAVGEPVKESSDSFLGAVQLAQRQMSEGLLQKVVLSRVLSAPSPKEEPIEVFNRLRFAYPAAFVCLTSIPGIGLWLGASPEMLVGWEGGRTFRTMALAGTRPLPESGDANDSTWSFKEIEEQAMVTRYIIEQFKSIRLREYTEEGPRAYAAGPVVHLRSDYTVDAIATERPDLADTMRDLLHPTSAVCGQPFSTAYDFIRENESHDRELYSGYWGPVLVEGESHLYVNLRCMRWDEESVRLYVGAGITAASKPEAELAETEIKTRTLRKVLEGE